MQIKEKKTVRRGNRLFASQLTSSGFTRRSRKIAFCLFLINHLYDETNSIFLTKKYAYYNSAMVCICRKIPIKSSVTYVKSSCQLLRNCIYVYINSKSSSKSREKLEPRYRSMILLVFLLFYFSCCQILFTGSSFRV